MNKFGQRLYQFKTVNSSLKLATNSAVRVVKGGLNHESREINEVFHDSRKFFEGFHVSRKISAGWNDYRVLGTIYNDRRV